MLLIAILLAGGQPAPAPPQPPTATQTRFGGLFTDWREANGDALHSEAARTRGLFPSSPDPERRARVLGDQVGEMVALGDCDGGERIALEAGDHALLSAVQTHCRRRVGVPASSRTIVPERPEL